MERLRTLIHRLEDGLITLLLSAMILLALLQILLRNFWDTGLIWGDPALRVLVLWVAMLGAMAATRDNNHIRIDLLSRYLPERLKNWSARFTSLFSALVSAMIAWHAGRFVVFEWEDGGRFFAGIPAWVCELIIPLGFAIMALRFLLNALIGLTPDRRPW